MTFGMLSRVLLVAVSASVKCPSGKGLCDCISSWDGKVLESATYKLLDVPESDCATEWISKPSSKSIGDFAGELSGKKLVTAGEYATTSASGTTGVDANELCRVKFEIDSGVQYHNPVSDKYGEPEYHHTKDGDVHDGNWYLGRVYGSDGHCHFGTWTVTGEADGEEFMAAKYDVLTIPSACEPSWKDYDKVVGSVLTHDEKGSAATAFCERSVVCAVKDKHDHWHPGYAVAAHRKQACTDFACGANECDGVCAGCDGCQTNGAPIGEGAVEGGCGMPNKVEDGSWTAGDVDSGMKDSSALVASVCLLAGLLAA